ncbi:MAG: EscJ/YscJ/HrcJ family type III secretion inner membrane ring protein [Simkaniaceae bacterium]
MFKKLSISCFFLLFLFLTSCGNDANVVSGVTEREANIIVVFLESKGIPATKIRAASEVMAGQQTQTMYDIHVPQESLVESMALLNQAGLPRQMGTDLLQLFAKAGLMSSDKEETIRYQAGLASQISNMIRLMDGVIDASVQLSFPPEQLIPGDQKDEKITAAVYVKHQGVFDDPNTHLESKVKRLVSGSITGLNINDVTVVSDKARYADLTITPEMESLTGSQKDYVSIWSIVMSEASASRFRSIFFALIFFALIFAVGFGWLIWKVYPIFKRKGGLKEIFRLNPIVPEPTHQVVSEEGVEKTEEKGL